jgi:uncharacterized protein (DUF2132 family)
MDRRRKVDDGVSSMKQPPANDPLHGLTLEAVVNSLVDHFGWTELGRRIEIKCFISDPSVRSSLKFLRRTPWARTKVENLYVWAIARRRPRRSK